MSGAYNRNQLLASADRAMAVLARLGLAPGGVTSMTVPGRTSGEPRTLPITPLVVEGREYLVAPFGTVGWVRNLRAAGGGTLKRGRRVTPFRATELAAEAAAPILRIYVEKVPIVRPHVAAAFDDPLEDFLAIAGRHPVFEVTRTA